MQGDAGSGPVQGPEPVLEKCTFLEIDYLYNWPFANRKPRTTRCYRFKVIDKS
jgi:hypothetical protein